MVWLELVTWGLWDSDVPGEILGKQGGIMLGTCSKPATVDFYLGLVPIFFEMDMMATTEYYVGCAGQWTTT